MFAFISTGGTIDREINNGGGPYVYRINGQNQHKIGSLLPPLGRNATFAQLYIYDTQNEIKNRMRAINQSDDSSSLDPGIVHGLKDMLDEYNPLAKAFRMARDRFQDSDYTPVSIRLIGQRNHDGRQYKLPTASEVAALIVGDGRQSMGNRDKIVETQTNRQRRINELHPSFMAMQYPILFPYAEDGFRTNIPRNTNFSAQIPAKRKWVTMREFHAYQNENRECEGDTLIHGGRLYNQYIVDAWTCIQENNLNWVRNNQKKLRAELYKGLCDAVVGGDTTPCSTGRRFVLPSTFTASEASWRIFDFDIQFKRPAIERLSFHLPDEKTVIFNDDDELDDVLNRETVHKTMFTEWMEANKKYESARELTYAEFPTKWLAKPLDYWEVMMNGIKLYKKLEVGKQLGNGGLFFVYGSGGIGKTYLWKTIITRLRLQGKIVLAVASSGIASLLLPGGRMSHSKFKIPMTIDEDTTCKISQGTPLAELICKATLVIWDEAPMEHRNVCETVSRTFQDIIGYNFPEAKQKVFGGKSVVLGGDFRQILPVVIRGGREDIVAASINRSKDIWPYCQVFLLTTNMRLNDKSLDQVEAETMRNFGQWVLDLGDGKLPVYNFDDVDEPSWIKIPDNLLISSGGIPNHEIELKEGVPIILL
ncbi:hypothetical protein BUALT_Bualt10G0066100 [Buddleja alternifolia]|uniref:ATP-dependent DNA helicase n=1 Tax=Buddleja alternifolia TaxID=168488 RepID=A0AAV6X4Q9_9LAMI|nr:hypothetical protein BUALT_Bualt10G0066100 [Buddleja alternifolia]